MQNIKQTHLDVTSGYFIGCCTQNKNEQLIVAANTNYKTTKFRCNIWILYADAAPKYKKRT